MQPGRAPTSGLGVPLLPLARQVGWVAPVRPALGVWFVAPCPSAALGGCACAVSLPTWHLFTSVRALCFLFVVSAATWRLFTGARAVCGMFVLLVALSGTPSPPFFVFLSLFFCPCLFVCALYLFSFALAYPPLVFFIF